MGSIIEKGRDAVKTHISLEDAVKTVKALPAVRQKEGVLLADALDRFLAEDVFSVIPIPPFDKSPFDGYACRTEDIPGTLRVSGMIAPGMRITQEVKRGEAVRIYTGSPIPAAASVVIKQEDVKAEGDRITVPFVMAAGNNIIRCGEDVQLNECLISAGTRLEPAHLGLLASQGIASVQVWRQPLICILSTGDELSEPGNACPKYGIYNSSYYALSGYLRKMGCRVRKGGIIPDDADAVKEAVRAALRSEADVVITTGGASVGDYDFARRTASDLGAEQLFWKVNAKPGGALMVSQWNHKPLFGLSGNPAAALMSLLVVLRPYFADLTGAAETDEQFCLPLLRDMPKTSSATRLLRGHIETRDGELFFAEHNGRGNGNLRSFAGCTAIGVVPGGTPALREGDFVKVISLTALAGGAGVW